MPILSPVPDGFDSYYLAQQTKPTLFVAQNDRRLLDIAEAIRAFNPELQVLEFPAWDCTPYDRNSPDSEIVGERLATLASLAHKPLNGIIVTTPNALLQRVLPKTFIQQAALHLEVGIDLPVEQLRRTLSSQGYHSTSTVRETGEFAVRGGIVDIFVAGQDNPVRLDFFGDEIESMRYFDAITQLTLEGEERDADKISLLPVREVPLDEESCTQFRQQYRILAGGNTEDDPLYEAVKNGQYVQGIEHFLPLFFEEELPQLQDYLPDDIQYIFDKNIETAFESAVVTINDHYEARAEVAEHKSFDGFAFYPIKPEQLYNLNIPKPDDALYFSNFKNEQSKDSGAIALTPALDAKDTYTNLIEHINAAFKAKKRVVVSVEQESRRQKLLDKIRPGATYPIFSLGEFNETKAKPKKSLNIIKPDHPIYGNGFEIDDLVFFTAAGIFGERLNRKASKRKAEDIIKEASTMVTDDIVVHEEHGIGQYKGLELLDVHGSKHDMVLLNYSGGDKLYLPVENIELLSRFGDSDSTLQLDKLGGASWQARKAKAKERIREIANDLMEIAAERELRSGETITPESGSFEEFCNRFPYMETDDQLGAIEDVLGDLASGKPMDRLICGDVGFGKTEIALRAAFIAAMQGFQVLMVSPTTLLCRQHYASFKERFKGFPINVQHLSRLVTAKEAKITKEGIADGTADIVVGTHALLAKGIKFKRPGLVIVDEEQRFGVKQKERLKEFKSDVHYMSLSATPIPRTMQMAMQGVRDMSIIATPPVDRLAIRTFITPFDRVSVREALMREHHRNGQSFFICPRVSDLREMQDKLAQIVPELKIITAHGQMAARELEDIMEAFQNGEYDVLLATQIVESGIDISKANTIIICRAHMFGLAQLYQLRGRVGRSKTRAYALLTYPPKLKLSKDATKRLEVMQTLDHLGAGFTLASHDLDIRGAGNLLGEEQSGHIREVGVELYQQMLQDAVATAQAESKQAEASIAASDTGWSPSINLGLPVLIPDDYVTDLDTRMNLYRRAAELENPEKHQAFREELQDRFGEIPQSMENLLAIVSLKGLCRKAGVAKVDVGPKGVVLTFHNAQFAAPEKLLQMISREKGTVKLRPDHKLVYLRVLKGREKILEGVESILKSLIELTEF